MELILQKAMSVHVTHERLVVLASTLLHAIGESKTPANARAYKEDEAEKVKRQKATLSEAVAAELKLRHHVGVGSAAAFLSSSSQRQQRPTESTTPSRHRQLNDKDKRAAGNSDEESCDLAERGRVPCRSASRLRRALAADAGPPVLSADYHLHFDLKSVTPTTTAASEPVVNAPPSANTTQSTKLPVNSPMLKLRAMSSPVARAPTPTFQLSLAAAAYTGAPLFVEPSPLTKRMSRRGISSANGTRRRLQFKKRPPQRIPTPVEVSSTRSDEVDVSNDTEPSDLSAGGDPNELSETRGNGEVSHSSRSSATDGHEEEAYEDDTYEDDFIDESEPGALSRLGDADKLDSDTELIDLLHDIPLQEPSAFDDKSSTTRRESSDSVDFKSESAAATCIQSTRKVNSPAPDERIHERRRSDSCSGEVTGGASILSLRSEGHSDPRGTSVPKKRAFSDRHRVSPLRHDGATTQAVAMITRSSSAADATRRAHRVLLEQTNDDRRAREQSKKPSSTPSAASALSSLSRSAKNASKAANPTAKLLGSLEKQQQQDVVAPAEALKRIQTLYAQGLAHHKENRVQQAIEAYEAALRVPAAGREFASLHINLGSAQMTQLQFSAALASFERAAQIHPSNPKAAYNCALALMHLGRTAQAREQVGHQSFSSCSSRSP